MLRAFSKSFKCGISVVFSALLTFLSMLQAPTAGVTADMPVIPEGFQPVLRFAVASDIHNATERLADMIDTVYELAQADNSYRYVDAFCFAGDFTNTGTDEEMQAIKSVFDEHIDADSTELVNILGNHEFGSDSATARERYEKIFGEQPEVHKVIKGFHFIGVSNSPGSKFPASVKKWTRENLREAERDDESKPIFVFQHPHNYATVYGSVNWGNSSTNLLWEGHHRVVNFSGHSHYPMNDPRSIWQGSYTALGMGSLQYFELEKELVAGLFPQGSTNAAQFYIVEVDASNRIAVRCYDLITHSFFGEQYYINDINDPSSYAYTYKNRQKYDKAPEFADETEITVDKNESGEYSVSFGQAVDTFVVHDYKVIIRDSSEKKIYYESFLSDYFLVDTNPVFTCALGKLELEQGKQYTVYVTACNSYYKLSEDISLTFTA